MTVLPIPVDAAQLSLNSFRDLANTALTLQLSLDGSGWKVAAGGPLGAKPLASEAETDTTAIFIEVLGQAFSRGIQEAVVRELELQPKPGQPLASSLVLKAIAMAEASRQALQGVDFMTQLQFSAVANAAGFVGVCRAMKLAPDAFGAPQRAAIDARMQQRFAETASRNEIPVAPETAGQWLHAELAAFNTHPPEAH